MQALASCLISTGACGEGCVGLWIGNLQNKGRGSSEKGVTYASNSNCLVSIGPCVCYLPIMNWVGYPLKKRKGRKERKFIYPKDSKVWTLCLSWWLEWSQDTSFPQSLFHHELWHGLLKRLFSYTLSFSQVNAEWGSLSWFSLLRFFFFFFLSLCDVCVLW